MSSEPVGSKALLKVDEIQPISFNSAPSKKNVLPEDKYTEDLEKIIVRDFFPDLPKLEAQKQYLDAVKQNDIQKLKELHFKYGSKQELGTNQNLYSTPASFETPDIKHSENFESSDSKEETRKAQERNPEPWEEKKECDKSLDRYLQSNTSEDNASFKDILTDNEEKHRLKHAWLYEREGVHQEEIAQRLALPSLEEQAAIKDRPSSLDGWSYEAKNSLMYIPDAKSLTEKEKLAIVKKQRLIHHKNTRFKQHPFNIKKSQETIAEAASNLAQSRQGKIGVDGKELLPSESPQVNGFGFLSTPKIVPGVDESPMMTWGEIEGTPFRLDASDTPRTNHSGPAFKIPNVPERDQIALRLADKASKAHRAKKQEAMRHVKRLATPTPKFGSMSKSERLSSMSPAAQRLASGKFGLRTDKSSLTPSTTRSQANTPDVKHSARKTPLVKLQRTPKAQTPKISTDTQPSLTDDLLVLPRRKQAADFF